MARFDGAAGRGSTVRLEDVVDEDGGTVRLEDVVDEDGGFDS